MPTIETAVQPTPTLAFVPDEPAAPTPVSTTEVIQPTNTPVLAISTAVINLPTAAPLNDSAAGDSAASSNVASNVQTIGYSVQGHPINSHRFGTGPNPLVLVGGMHGGYEWNTIVLAYDLIDHFSANPELVPGDITLYIIPSANPDGQMLVTGTVGPITGANIINDTRPGRFNGNNVDLNRNWDCEWNAQAFWGDQSVNAGERPFSEPETQALSAYLLTIQPRVVVFYHSAAGGVFPGRCGDAAFAASREIASFYSSASGYPIFEAFTNYTITGDASDWLATLSVPSFSVELYDHTNIDWEQNLNGVKGLLNYYSSGS